VDDAITRLVRCFTAVFAGMNDAEAERASVETIAEWDSIATVTLVSVVEEEFGIRVRPQDVQQLTSFDRFRSYVEANRVAA
jgi:acyl carrier protein